MELKVKHIFLTAVFCLFSLFSLAQMAHPPEPRMNHQEGHHGPGEPCGQEDGQTQQPPPGLCLPVDDYIYPFLVLAILFGAYKVHKIEAAKD